MASMNKVDLASRNKVELPSMNKADFPSIHKVDLRSMNNVERASSALFMLASSNLLTRSILIMPVDVSITCMLELILHVRQNKEISYISRCDNKELKYTKYYHTIFHVTV